MKTQQRKTLETLDDKSSAILARFTQNYNFKPFRVSEQQKARNKEYIRNLALKIKDSLNPTT